MNEPTSTLRLAHQAGAMRQNRTCPSCQKELPGDATFCVHCGYDWREGKKVRAHLSPLPLFWWVKPVSAFALVAIILAAGLHLRARDRVARAEEQRLRSEEERTRHEALVEERLERLRGRLDETHPMWETGQSATARRRDGTEHHGLFAGTEEGDLLLDVEAGRIAVPIETLDEESRVRCDPDFREAFLLDVLSRRFRPARPL